MTKTTIFALLAATGLAIATRAEVKTDIIPRPSELSLKSQETITIATNPTIKIEADTATTGRLSAYMNQVRPSWMVTQSTTPAVTFKLSENVEGIGSPEGYRLTSDPDAGCLIEATGEAGLFYGLQSQLQLLDANGDTALPQVEITDNPRFGYRGMMIDVSRNFFDKEFIKKQLDVMARLKLNTFHFHLTDGAGWRLEIDSYPRLTEYAAWRKGTSWKDWVAEGKKYAESTDPETKGGYYTKDDIREILAYAAERHINVIPEIEMPSHSEEVTSAYPELSCTHNPAGEFDYCPGNEKTFEFLQNVLDEVTDLFPSEYINIGGDEALKTHWHTCELCAKRMKEEGLDNVDQLQSYLVHRIEQYLNSKGRKLIGWDEIMEGGLAPNAAVVSWRGIDGGVRAATAGHKVVMAPGRYCYFDGYPHAPATQREALGGYRPLALVDS
ncbi:MAG: beta-N-acetylhexosaminidase, partial [Paramuribaculum sp.]|nr:beta-N-acetylhexosaminidase [Paramuribaculum sp.]